MRLEFWTPVATRLAGQARVVAVDLRGHGENPPSTADFTIKDLADDVIALIRRLDLEPALLVGCSLGGMVCQAVALNAPRLVSGLVLANTTHAMTDESRAVMLQRAGNCERDFADTVESDISRWFSPAFRALQPDVVDRVRRWALANDAATVARGWRAIAGLDYGKAVASIPCPVVVTTGALDPASPPAAARAMTNAFSNARYVEIPEAGHFSPLERPLAFAAIVEALEKTC